MPTDPEHGGAEGEGSDPLARDAYARFAGMGLTFAVTVVAFGAAGWWVDRRLSTTPLFLIVGTLLGFGGGLYSMVKRVPPAHGRRPRP